MSLLILNAAKIPHTLPREKFLSFDPTTGLEYSYNFLNLPCTVFDGEEMQLQYTYFADGTKYSVMRDFNEGYVYVGPFVYKIHPDYDYPFLESVSSEEGRLVYDESSHTWRDCWFTKDHIGNVRTVLDLSKSASAPLSDIIVEQDSYLPFGTKSANPALFGSNNRYRLAGKEEQCLDNFTTTLTDFGARSYSPTVCRWMMIDPMAEKYPGMSPYNYCGNNPVVFVDPDGIRPYVFIETSKLGHAFIPTGTGKNLTIYTFGRTGNVPNFFKAIHHPGLSPVGEGVLTILKGDLATQYLRERKESNIHYTIFGFDCCDSVIDSYYNDLFSNGYPATDGVSFGKENAKVIYEYNVLFENCVTTTIKGLSAAGVDVVSDRGTLALSPAEFIFEVIKSGFSVETFIGQEAIDYVNRLIGNSE